MTGSRTARAWRVAAQAPSSSTSVDPQAEHDTIVRAQGGDRTAFDVIYRRYARTVFGILLARVARADAEDLVQDVFVIALQRLASLRDPAALPGWLAAIARHRAVDHLRRSPLTTELPDGLTDGAADRTESRAALDAIRTLPEAYRETLMLRLVEGMTGPEIAARTGLTEGSVRVNLHRGMKLLRELLERRPA